jgi:cation-transporting ATPase 13A1
MRTILFSTERVTVESRETYLYLLILLCFALIASYYVLTEGLKDPDRSRYKLMLRCILIITNVVPPELPMELSMAVNYSII